MCNPLKPSASPGGQFLAPAWPGVAIGLALVLVLFSVYGGYRMDSGLGTAAGMACGLLFGIVALIAGTALALLGLALVRRIPLLVAALIITVLAGLIVAGDALGLPWGLSLRLGAWPVLLSLSAGAGLSILRRRGTGRAGVVSAVVAGLLLLVTLVVAGALLYWLAAPGQDPFLALDAPATGQPVVPLDAPNPSEAGSYKVGTLFYGSGTDPHRPEYGANVDLKTEPVDASLLLPPRKGLGRWSRYRYWKLEPNSLPRNGRVWFPEEDGALPLVVIVHGNHKMTEFSDPGYAYLGELLASRGFIVASIDENFLNDDAEGDGPDIRAWLLLKHLELWRTWNEQQGNPFYQKVDLMNIALIGHSRGGEAIIHAATFNGLSRHPDHTEMEFNFGFDIRTLIALAPTDGQYYPRGQAVPIANINYLVLQGSHDSDLGTFYGMAPYERLMLGRADYRVKAALYIYRANHSQFNTAWGRCDLLPPLKHVLNRGPVLDGADQRTIAKVYVSAFLEMTLHGKYEYLPMFRDQRRAAHWLPKTRYLSRFRDSDFVPVADCDRSLDATETSIPGGFQQGEFFETWQVRELKGRRDRPGSSNAVFLGWNISDATADIPTYTINLPDALRLGWGLDERVILSFCLGDTGERCKPRPGGNPGQACGDDPNDDQAAIDLTLELAAFGGAVARLPLSHVRPLPRAIPVTLTKWPGWEKAEFKSPTEPVLQTFEIPLRDFVNVNPDFDPGQLKLIRFRFDRTRSGVIVLDDVGLARNRHMPFTP